MVKGEVKIKNVVLGSLVPLFYIKGTIKVKHQNKKWSD